MLTLNNIFFQLFIELIVNLFILLLLWIRNQYSIFLSKKDPRIPPLILLSSWGLWFLLNLTNLITNYGLNSTPWITITVFIISSLIVLYFTWIELDQYWRSGLRGSDKKIKNGIDYKKSLELVQNEIQFLGTGAAKLTREQGFEDALNRCRSDKAIRFLLSKPTEENLAKAAKKANKPNNEYKRIVIESLKKIADLKNRREINIEVRFYPEASFIHPLFRLFFIDNHICLVSYNVYGEGDGSQLPQLHIVKASEKSRASESFYYPFELFFNWLWEKSGVWDFKKYIT